MQRIGMGYGCRPARDQFEEVIVRLVEDFPGVDRRAIAREVARAVGAVVWIALGEDQLPIVELIARAQLEMRLGDRPDVARLDPQPRPRRDRAHGTAVLAV